MQDRLLHHTLLKAFSPTGIPAMVLAGLVDELNESVNIALHRLSNGELEVELRTSRATAGKTSENKVTVYVRTGTGTRAYETLSGGQKFRVDLAIRTGLAATIARGTGTPIQTLILDEGWGSLEETGILSTVDTLFRLSDEVNILTVSTSTPSVTRSRHGWKSPWSAATRLRRWSPRNGYSPARGDHVGNRRPSP